MEQHAHKGMEYVKAGCQRVSAHILVKLFRDNVLADIVNQETPTVFIILLVTDLGYGVDCRVGKSIN